MNYTNIYVGNETANIWEFYMNVFIYYSNNWSEFVVQWMNTVVFDGKNGANRNARKKTPPSL